MPIRDIARYLALVRQGETSVPARLALMQAHRQSIQRRTLQPAWQPQPVRQSLLRALGESATLTAVLLLADLACYPDALPYLAMAQDAARENDDPDLTAVLLACRAFLTSFSGGSPAVAADVAEAAVTLSIDGAASPIARDAVAAHDPDPAWAGVGTFDSAKATAYEGGNLVRLGRYGDAVDALDKALAALEPTMYRHRCTALIDRAEAHLAADQVDASCADAAAALGIAVHTEHLLSVQRVRRLAEAALPTKATAARGLWAEVLAVTPTSPHSSTSR